jgi:hypothetical protein
MLDSDGALTRSTSEPNNGTEAPGLKLMVV